MSEVESLVVVSKLKSYIKSSGGLATSSDVPTVLSSAIKVMVDEAIENAKKDGRKTLMERDFKSTQISA